MAITTWPKDERPREKLLKHGARALSDAELLAIFIRTGVRGKTAVDVSRDLIERFGGLRKILVSEKESFCAAAGLGPAKYVLLQAALELNRRFLDEKLKLEDGLTDPKQAAEYLTQTLRDQPVEVFAVLYLNNRHQVIHYEELFHGTLNSATVHPREVVKKVLQHNAAAIIVAHNHPSGIAEPSASDTSITQTLQRALNLIDVRLLDHLIIGNGHYVSLNERGLLPT